ncbi:MAG: acetyl-CoA carboxylase carboxyltransferase subunit alpha [Planctomycetota bacterium]|nr:MAG: acetyl-CoA carboxylase carboxyltransferase subunit alpha [Planctomycetota bacterium]REJ98508.1 MAG: acetyl-CoA carboxylase carboxyltransferase subunit alpha [Planctomycetota bacterium]REK23674.1 MAG: acetyl-CoA carboxylase carboxyltransferase subunit alpha [Planctomycetota bacterium]REK31198.1 MAG: acetyl-CoA carboxylase carboxyltransferase subunit alpha [Planctomycetota bacterium]
MRPLPFERKIYDLETQLEQLGAEPNPSPVTKDAIRTIRRQLNGLKREIYDNLDPWQIVQVARHEDRPQTLDYLELLFDEFIELHGDKAYSDDRAILTGFAKLDDQKLMFIGQQKGRNLEEREAHNYGMAHPEGYRKALAKMQIAAKFGLPVVCFIDTAGAYPGIGAEERGQAYQIALNLREMARTPTPIVCVIIGEGGSGGALGIGVGDHVAILQFAYYSVISPEGCAGILWKHQKYAERAAQALRFTAKDLLEFGIVDEIIGEPLGGAHRDHRQMATALKASLNVAIRELSALPQDQLLDRRYEKFRRIGVFEENPEAAAAVESA